MLYAAYQTHSDMMVPVRSWALAGLSALAPWANSEELRHLRSLTAAYELIARAGLTHVRPPYGITSVRAGNRDVAITEEAVASTAFGTLLHFAKDIQVAQPRVLVVAPLSGHFATLLRSLVRTLLVEHDVCITDWHNARDAGMEHGRFGFAIRRTALLTVEGEPDDICSIGQTSAAHDLCNGLKPYLRRHHMQAGVAISPR
jgi:poly(3-hydroxybutyrate) depolymerase